MVGMDVEPKRATTRVLESIKQDVLPQLRADFPGITWSFQGTQAEMRESTQALRGGFVLAIGVIYALLAIAFGSYVQPLIVMVIFATSIILLLVPSLYMILEDIVSLAKSARS